MVSLWKFRALDKGIMGFSRGREGRLTTTVRSRSVQWVGRALSPADWVQIPAPLDGWLWASHSTSLNPPKEDNICLIHCRFIITCYPMLFLMTDTEENLLASGRERNFSSLSSLNPSATIASQWLKIHWRSLFSEPKITEWVLACT